MSRSPAFTLIELLIVIAIIALLLGILLPTLGSAREAGRTLVCSSNVRQLAMSFHTYANDHGRIPGTYWQGPINLDWCGRNNIRYTQSPQSFPHPLYAAPLAEYLSTLDRITECPTGKRRANTYFDYTMVIRMAGARIDLPWMARYPLRPAQPNSEVRHFQALPLLIEEHEKFNNQSWDDGSWAADDQVTRRHKSGTGGGHIGYLDGSISLFQPPNGGNHAAAQPNDLRARHVKLIVRARVFDLHQSAANECGWVNGPK